MLLTARSVMTHSVLVVSPDQTVEEGIRLLTQHNISGAPVVGQNGALLGIVSEFNLLGAALDAEIAETPLSQVMTRNVVTVTSATPLDEVAKLLIHERIRRLPVVDSTRLVGIVSRRDLLRCAVNNINEYRRIMASFASADFA